MKRLLTPSDVAEIIGKKPATVRDYIRRGIIPAIVRKGCRNYEISAAALEKYIAEADQYRAKPKKVKREQPARRTATGFVYPEWALKYQKEMKA